MLKGVIYSPLPMEEAQLNEIRQHFAKLMGDEAVLQFKLDPTLIGGIRVEVDGRVYDGSIKKRLTLRDDRDEVGFEAGDGSTLDWLENPSATVEEDATPPGQVQAENNGKAKKKRRTVITGATQADMEELERRLRRMAGFKTHSDVFPVGYVLSVGDGIAHVSGLNGCRNGELLRFDGDKFGIAFNLEKDNVGVILLDKDDAIEQGSKVEGTGRVVAVPVGEELLGRVVDPLGRPIDGGKPIRTQAFRPVESGAPPIVERSPVKAPLQTGYLAIDAMVPIGRGQRELIIGDRQTGKTAIAVDTILNQKDTGVICVYVAIGQKASTVAQVRQTLERHDAMAYTTIVCSTASDPAPMQYIAPYSGCAMAEEFMYKGRDVLIVYDDLSKHAVAYRAISLLLRRPPGREAYPGDVFYLHSRLLERAAKLSGALGGGSMTALPIIETMAGDISAYIPTNVISITDGQIFLESDLFHAGVRPAVNVGLSVSRVGGSAQTKAMRKVAGQLRLDLAQYRELAVFAQFGSDLDNATRDLLLQGEKLTELLKQDQFAPMPMAVESVLLYIMTRGLAAQIEAKDIVSFKGEVIEFIRSRYPQILLRIDQSQQIDAETEKLIRTAVQEYVKR